MSTVENSELSQALTFLQEETPKIDSALKNLVSILAGKSFSTNNEFQDSLFTPGEALQCAQVFMKGVNGVSFQSVGEWVSSNPQREDQTAIDRMDEIIHYKALQKLQQICFERKSAGAKISKLFGKSYFLWSRSWDSIRTQSLIEFQASRSTVSIELFNLFLDEFQKSLHIPFISQSTSLVTSVSTSTHLITSTSSTSSSISTTTSQDESTIDYDIWTTDFDRSNVTYNSREKDAGSSEEIGRTKGN